MLERAYSQAQPRRCVDMSDGQNDLDEMVDWLYAGDFSKCVDKLLECSTDLLEVLQCQTTNSTYHTVPIKMGSYADSRKNVMASLVSKVLRIRKQFKIPPLTAIITSEFQQVHVNEFVWEIMCSTRVGMLAHGNGGQPQCCPGLA